MAAGSCEHIEDCHILHVYSVEAAQEKRELRQALDTLSANMERLTAALDAQKKESADLRLVLTQMAEASKVTTLEKVLALVSAALLCTIGALVGHWIGKR